MITKDYFEIDDTIKVVYYKYYLDGWDMMDDHYKNASFWE